MTTETRRRAVLLLYFLVLSVSLLLPVMHVSAASQLTNGDSEADLGGADGNDIVWTSRWANGGYLDTDQVFLYDGSTTRQLTYDDNTLTHDQSAKVSGNYVAWYSRNSSTNSPDSYKMYLYNISTEVTTQIGGDSQVDFGSLMMRGDKIFWLSVLPPGRRIDIFDYDITTGQTTDLTNGFNNYYDQYNYSYSLNDDGSAIAWLRKDSGTSTYDQDACKGYCPDVMTENVNTGQVTQITHETHNIWDSVAMTGGHVFWMDRYTDGSNQFSNQIYMWNGSQIIQITNTNDQKLQMSAGGNQLVYSRASQGDQYSSIYSYDIVTGSNNEISDNGAKAVTNGSIVAFARSVNYSGFGDLSEVFVKNLSTGITSEVTKGMRIGGVNENIYLTGGHVVWSAEPVSDYVVDHSVYTTWQIWQSDLGNTTAGDNISVQSASVNIVFDEVKVAGNTVVSLSSNGAAAPNNYVAPINPVYYNISSNAILRLRSSLQVCIDYAPTNLQGPESQTRILRYDTSNNWADITSNLDTTNHRICGETNNPNAQYLVATRVNTPQGANVQVNIAPISLNFAQVTSGGNSTVTSSNSGSQPPMGFKLGNPPLYYHISTTATFSGNVQVCINYDPNTVQGNQNNLKLMHFDSNNGWTNITSSLDTTDHVICGITTSFSDFSIMTAPTLDDLISSVEQMNLQQGISNSLDSKLQAAQQALNAEHNNDINTASNNLNAFINYAIAQSGNKLTVDQANQLISYANNLIKLINNQILF